MALEHPIIKIFSALGASGSSTTQVELGVEWKLSEHTYPGVPPFLAESFIRSTCEYMNISKRATSFLLLASGRIAKNKEALRLLWHFHHLIVQNYSKFSDKAYIFPELPNLHQDRRAFYLLLALSGLSKFGYLQEKDCFHREAIQATIGDFCSGIELCREESNLVGLTPHFAGWYQGFFAAEMFRIGRFQFKVQKYQFPFRILQNTTSRQLLALALDGLEFDNRGLLTVPGLPTCSWRSVLTETGSTILGHPIHPKGYAHKEPISLSKQEWTDLVHRGDPVLGVHIPQGSSLEIGQCQESFQQAFEFWRNYYPGIQVKGLVSESWIRDPNLFQYCSSPSNLLEYNRRFYLLPSNIFREQNHYASIFKTTGVTEIVDFLPQATRLQRGAAEYKKKGGVFRHGAAFFPKWDWGEPIEDMVEPLCLKVTS